MQRRNEFAESAGMLFAAERACVIAGLRNGIVFLFSVIGRDKSLVNSHLSAVKQKRQTLRRMPAAVFYLFLLIQIYF